MIRAGAFVIGIAATVIALFAAAGQQPDPAAGAYTEAQAAEGAALYKGACAMCHGDNLMGSFEVPALIGRFAAHWSNGSIGALFEYVSSAMPQMAPGSLAPEDNARIVAFLLKANGMPAGTNPLPTNPALLKRIKFETAAAK